MAKTAIVPPLRTLRPGALSRAVLAVDRGCRLCRVIPMPVMIALDEPHLIMDAHLCHGGIEGDALLGFKARACAYAATTLSRDKQRFLYDNVMSLEDIVRAAELVPLSPFEVGRAELFDAIQGGNRAVLLGARPLRLRNAAPERSTAFMDHA